MWAPLAAATVSHRHTVALWGNAQYGGKATQQLAEGVGVGAGWLHGGQGRGPYGGRGTTAGHGETEGGGAQPSFGGREAIPPWVFPSYNTLQNILYD